MLLGDVVVCPAVAARNAVDHGVSYDDEVALLVVHGLLHLLGMDHVEETEAERMESLERQLLRRFYRATYEGEGGSSDGETAGDAEAGTVVADADDGTGE
jgi:ssRNA-specific RNase YbeY (16S rRNA maturation enzyme)